MVSVRRFFLVLVLLLLLPTAHVALADGLDDLFIRGFVSQGYLNTSKNNYLVPRSVNGTAEFSEAALLVSASPSDRLRIGMQLMARNFGNMGSGEVKLDWAYGDYRWRDELGVRLGRVKLPFGLYNEGRDVDLLRTSVFLPQSVYNEKIRDLIQAYEGAGAYGTLDLGSVGEAEYHVYGGTLNVPDSNAEYWNQHTRENGYLVARELGLANDEANDWEPGTTEVDFIEDDNAVITFPWIWGGSLIWSTPVDGLRLGTSFMTGRFNYSGKFQFRVRMPDLDPVTLDLDVDETNNINHEFTASAEYHRDDLLLATEYYHENIDGEGTLGWYAMAGYQVSDLISLASIYSVAFGDKGDRSGDRYTSAGLPDYYAWLKDLTFSSRFDLTPSWLFKLEYHFFDGVEQDITLPSVTEDPLAQNWGMFTAKTTFAF